MNPLKVVVSGNNQYTFYFDGFEVDVIGSTVFIHHQMSREDENKLHKFFVGFDGQNSI